MSSEVCELHVWGAIPTYRPGTFAGPGARVGTLDADRSNPVSNINVFDPLVRLRGVEDSRLAALLGNAKPVRVVRHDVAIDVKRAKRAKLRLATSQSACYADFVLLELCDIGQVPNPDEYKGLLVGLLMARAGFHGTYIFNRFGPEARPLKRTKASMITALAISRPNWHDDPRATVAALDASVAAGIARMATKVASPPR